MTTPPIKEEERCARCGHEAREHISPAIDLGIPMSGDVCQWGECPCRDYAAPASTPIEEHKEETR